jgi:hypothetical protein
MFLHVLQSTATFNNILQKLENFGRVHAKMSTVTQRRQLQNAVTLFWQIISGLNYVNIKGPVARDFRPLFFFVKQYPWVH